MCCDQRFLFADISRGIEELPCVESFWCGELGGAFWARFSFWFLFATEVTHEVKVCDANTAGGVPCNFPFHWGGQKPLGPKHCTENAKMRQDDFGFLNNQLLRSIS